MHDVTIHGVHLTKDYIEDFLPTDLQWPVTDVANDFTLYDLFLLVNKASEMIPNIAATMGMTNFGEFFREVQKDSDAVDHSGISHLELYWSCDYDIDDEISQDNPKVGELPNIMSLHGVGPGCACQHMETRCVNEPCSEDHGYAIEFTPVNDLAHLPIRVSPKVQCYPPFVERASDFQRTAFQLTITPTLWCFITSVFWELTFVGSTPDQIAGEAETVFDQVEEMRRQMEKQEGEFDVD